MYGTKRKEGGEKGFLRRAEKKVGPAVLVREKAGGVRF